MNPSTDPVSPDHAEEPIHFAAPLDADAPPIRDGQRDLYAESELVRRQERTERMIRRAQEQV